MTQEELNKYLDRSNELKMLIENCCINIKYFPKMNKYREELTRYTKEFKNITNILKKEKKKALKNGL